MVPKQVKQAQVWRLPLSEGSSNRPAGPTGSGRVGVGVYLRRFAHAAAPVINLVKIEDLALKIGAFNFDFLVLG